MNTIESSQQNEPNRGGAAPPDRQCQYTLASGYHCRRWSIRGHDYCHEHGRFMETRVDGPLEIPLMEDPSAVQLVVTQTVRALSWGQIPPANGRGILHGCRIVQNGFAQQLAEAKFRLKCHQLGLNPDHFLPPRAGAPFTPGAPFKPVVGLSGTDTGCPISPAVGDMGKCESADDLSGQEESTSAASLARMRECGRSPGLQPGERSASVEGASAPAPEAAHPGELDLDAAIGPPNPLDDLPPAPRPQSVCDPCVAAIVQGADESLLDCKNCPAHRSGNLRPPQLPDPRNPPEPRHDSGCPIAWPERSGEATQSNGSPDFGDMGRKQPAFRNLKTKWDRALYRFSDHCAGLRYPVHHPLKTETEYAAELAEMRARPFDGWLRAVPTSPPPPIPIAAPEDPTISSPPSPKI